MAWAFAKDINYVFYPLIDNEPVELVTQTPAIYVFETENMPSISNARDGTGANQTIATWVETVRDQRSFTISAISDPSPTSTTHRADYWLAINFILKTAGDTVTKIFSLPLERPEGQYSAIDIQGADLRGIWPDAETYADNHQIQLYVAEAIDDLKVELKDAGYEWGLIYDPKRLKKAVVYRVLFQIAVGQSKGTGEFDTQIDVFGEQYTSKLKAIKFDYDSNRDGKPDETVKTKSDFALNIR